MDLIPHTPMEDFILTYGHFSICKTGLRPRIILRTIIVDKSKIETFDKQCENTRA